jgi:hypothetical protein
MTALLGGNKAGQHRTQLLTLLCTLRISSTPTISCFSRLAHLLTSAHILLALASLTPMFPHSHVFTHTCRCVLTCRKLPAVVWLRCYLLFVSGLYIPICLTITCYTTPYTMLKHRLHIACAHVAVQEAACSGLAEVLEHAGHCTGGEILVPRFKVCGRSGGGGGGGGGCGFWAEGCSCPSEEVADTGYMLGTAQEGRSWCHASTYAAPWYLSCCDVLCQMPLCGSLL